MSSNAAADNATTVSTSTRKSTSDKLFGRDEMAALLSVDASMPTAASSGHAGGSSRNSKKRGGANGKDEEIDISRLNAYETAEYLSRLKQQKTSQHNRKRLRADTSKMEYQKLLEEQQEASTFHLTPVPAAAPQRSSVQEEYISSIMPSHNSREDETSNASVSSSSNENHYRRRRREPEIIIRKSEPRKEERSISSSSSSSEESSSVSSESEDEIDARRRRIREKAMASTQSTTPSIDKPLKNEEKAEEEATTQSNVSPSLSFAEKMFDASTDTVSTDKDSSSSSSSSEDEATPNLGHQCRPLFIPKHQRATTKLDSLQQQQQQEQEEKERQRIREKRKQESRAMVKQIVLQSKKEDDNTLNNYNSISIEEEDLVTGMGVNPPPDDTDTCETKEDELRMYHTWQVRELLRCVFHGTVLVSTFFIVWLPRLIYLFPPSPVLYWKNSSRTR
jgi:hypothetical protein